MSGLTYDLTLAGLSVGAAAALTGIGLVVTYRATGVLNFAHGAVAMVCAYALRQCVVEWGWPLWAGTAVTLLVLAPAVGVALERFVFRPLSVLGGDPARTLVASIGVFVLLVGGAALLWGQGARDDAPEVLGSADPWGQLAVVLALACTVGAVVRWTRFGRELRAVVDDRRLAVLGGVDADRVASAGWAFGSFTAGLTGVLLAPYVRLDPYGLPLLVMEVVAVAVAARMRSLPVAVLTALGIGVAQAQLTRLHPSGWGEPLLQAVGANLFVVALLIAALALPRVGARDALPRTATARVPTPPGAWIVALVLFLLPLGFAGRDLHTSVQVPALGVVLLSLVVVTGRGGQISLGQAAYAGLGALFTALLAAGRFPGLPRLPELAALALAVLLVAPLGLLTGWPAISRRGLALALATFAVGVGVSRFVFAQPYATSGLALGRPAGFEGDRAYYVLELLLLAAALLATRTLRTGRTGRALAAMRDHEAGASAAGVRVPSLKLLAFVAGAALAALGGGMLGMGLRAFEPGAFDPVRGLLWFAAVVVLGADSTLGALAAAALLVGLDAGARGGVAAALIGVLAVLVGRFPGGPHEALRDLTARLRPSPGSRLTPHGETVRARLTEARTGAADTPAGTEAGAAGRRTARGKEVRAQLRARLAGARTAATGTSPGAGDRGAAPDEGVRTGARTPAAGTPAGAESRGTARGETARPRLAEARTGAAGTPAGTEAGAAGRRTARGKEVRARLRSRLAAYRTAPAGLSADAGHRQPAPDEEARARRPGSPPPATGTSADAGGRRAAPDEGVRAGARTPATGTPAGAKDRPTARERLRARLTGVRTPAPGPAAEDAGRAARHPGRPGQARPGPHDADGPVRPAGPTGPTGPAAPASPTRPAAPARRPSTAHPPLLTTRGLKASYDGFRALDGVDLEVHPGRITAVVGPNGAGKSTLFHCLAGTLRPSEGQVRYGARDITRLPAHTRTRLGVGRTFQQLAVFPSLTVAENVRVGAEQGHVDDPAAVDRALRLMGLDGPVREAPAADLPTGTLRRVELARALAGGPRVLLLDEPAAGLDTAEVTALARVLMALAADGTALLVVEHDLDLVADLADVVHVMAAGRVVASGPPGRVLDTLAARETPA
ncbi:ATP-binding cassette domain-containing protein [Streptomyces sp. NPDC000983]|uniref:ABC transporter permease subunit n=1 Tax=Streptomyces sp. NPDC000983 TaxID=3154373 RepID=UPI0033171A34